MATRPVGQPRRLDELIEQRERALDGLDLVVVPEQARVGRVAYRLGLVLAENRTVEIAYTPHEGAVGIGAGRHAGACPRTPGRNRLAAPAWGFAVSFVRSGEREAVAATETQTDPKLLSEPKLLYFYSPKSGPSRRVEAFLDQVLQERNNHEAFSRGRIDVDRAPQLAEHFAVEALPTIVVLEEGRSPARSRGASASAAFATRSAPG